MLSKERMPLLVQDLKEHYCSKWRAANSQQSLVGNKIKPRLPALQFVLGQRIDPLGNNNSHPSEVATTTKPEAIIPPPCVEEETR